jgi:hypothetical protein
MGRMLVTLANRSPEALGERDPWFSYPWFSSGSGRVANFFSASVDSPSYLGHGISEIPRHLERHRTLSAFESETQLTRLKGH